ncbi:hypothetical protein OGAPHI_002867 [Ogataea philodendri]|uniref:Nitrogen regulatory protein areA GATA-like domain-containing protein n=1 Tax=Ogataea philodendri TaxID=1378263 RepID=A0A9P8T5P5_9ASCO|nr:uncharacterized protein OGAPHI_002867 [Ogataea philodendri]KAH3667218.1 hypothetical protein OGAPHI_002867 [Ogataea philodendri]
MSKEVFNEGPTTSQHIDAENDDHFNNTTFKLKRTRSLGLLDDFITQTQSLDTNSTPGKDSKLTSKDFVSDATLQKLNIKSTYDDTENIPRFYTRVIPSSSKNKRVVLSNSPQSTHSDELSDENCNSEDSTTTTATANSISLTPKHELRKQQNPTQIHEHDEIPAPSLIFQHHLHDDIDVEHAPEQHVDYLSHDWDEMEISKSWRYVTLKRNNFANSARLENASWRTWAQARNGLKTISPAELNWSKESDVTWLYGPLYKEEKHEFDIMDFKKHQKSKQQDHKSSGRPTSQTFVSCPSSNDSSPTSPCLSDRFSEHLKPILKKRTNVEKMISDASYSRLQTLLEEHDHKFKGSPILESIGHTYHDSPSPGNLSSHVITGDASPFSLSANAMIEDVNKLDNHLQGTNNSNKKERRIHFNMRVDQCIAIDDISDSDVSADNEYDSESDDNHSAFSTSTLQPKSYDDDYDEMGYPNAGDEDDEDDEDGGFMLRTRVVSPNISHRPSIRYGSSQTFDMNSRNNSSDNSRNVTTIAPLPATTLKTCSDDEEADPYTVSHNTRTNRGYDYYYDYNTVYDDTTNPLFSVINSQQNVEVYDVPESCQIEDVMDVDENSVNQKEEFANQSWNERSNYEFPISTSGPEKDLSDKYELPSRHSNMKTNPVEHGTVAPQQLASDKVSSDLHKNSSASGHFDSTSSGSSLSTIKAGLSGLDLGKSGLRRSSSTSSKSALYQMAQEPVIQGRQSQGQYSITNANRRNFVFDDSDEEDDSSEDKEMEINPPRHLTNTSHS